MNDLEWGRAWLWPWLFALPWLLVLALLLFDRSRDAVRRWGARGTDRFAAPLGRAVRLTLLATFGLLAWMDPRYGDEPVQVERRGLDVIVCLDTSRSMLAGDLEPNRLQRALQDIRALLPTLQGGDRVGLVVFAGEARIWIPLTHDLDSFRALLDEVDVDVVKKGGTDLAAALQKALELSRVDDAATTAAVLLTDGEDLAGAGRQAADELKAKGITVHTIGYGSARGSKITVREGDKEGFLRDKNGQEVVTRLDPESLRAVATATGGTYLSAESTALPLNELHEKRLRPQQKRAYDAGQEQGKQARYQWVLLPLLLLLCWEIALAGGRHR